MSIPIFPTQWNNSGRSFEKVKLNVAAFFTLHLSWCSVKAVVEQTLLKILTSIKELSKTLIYNDSFLCRVSIWPRTRWPFNVCVRLPKRPRSNFLRPSRLTSICHTSPWTRPAPSTWTWRWVLKNDVSVDYLILIQRHLQHLLWRLGVTKLR